MLIFELYDIIRWAKVYSKLHLRGAYNLVWIEGDKCKSTFKMMDGRFEYLVMPFVLFNAPAEFKEMVNTMFQDLLHVYVVVYLDDIQVFFIELHKRHIWAVLIS